MAGRSSREPAGALATTQDGTMTILYEQWSQHAQHLASVLGPDVTVVDSAPDLVDAVNADEQEVLVVFGPSTALAEAVLFAEQSLTRRPWLGVILLRHHLDASVLAEAKRAGVREVVAVGDTSAIVEACARSVEASHQHVGVNGATGPDGPTEGQIIAVFSGKGGTGKSVIATNLAVALAASGERRVCLVDLDLAFGDVAIMLELAPTRTIASAIPVADRIDETGLRTLLTRHRSGVDTLLAPVQPADAEQISRDLIAEILHLARGAFDLVVVDCASQLNDQTLAALDAAHHYLLVTTPELPALKSLRVTLDTFNLLDYQRERRIVVLNRADSKVGLTVSDVERAIRIPVAAFVPSSRDVPMSINKGMPIVLEQPSHAVSVAIKDLASKRFPGRSGRSHHRRRLLGRLSETRKG
jgi:pilus assembly protein CpaE